MHWFFVAAIGLSLVAGGAGYRLVVLLRLLLLRSTDSRAQARLLAARGLSRCSNARGIFLEQGSNLCLWQADSQPLDHQASPKKSFCRQKGSSSWKVKDGYWYIFLPQRDGLILCNSVNSVNIKDVFSYESFALVLSCLSGSASYLKGLVFNSCKLSKCLFLKWLN